LINKSKKKNIFILYLFINLLFLFNFFAYKLSFL
jgi:hypothetical protein